MFHLIPNPNITSGKFDLHFRKTHILHVDEFGQKSCHEEWMVHSLYWVCGFSILVYPLKEVSLEVNSSCVIFIYFLKTKNRFPLESTKPIVENLSII